MYSELEADQQQTFVDMLEEDDPDLLMWFSRKAVPENKQMAALVEIILNRVQP
jgi:antitoxin CptB